jgi:hypothetical protein
MWLRVNNSRSFPIHIEDLIAAHGAKTGSQKAQYLPKFRQLVTPSEASAKREHPTF